MNVSLRGPVLIVPVGTQVPQALIPNAETNAISHEGQPWTHPDGAPAVKHYSRLIVFETASRKIVGYASLLGRRLIIDDLSATATAMSASYAAITPLSLITNSATVALTLRPSSAADFWTRTATAVEFHGGVVGSADQSRMTFSYSEAFHPGHGWVDRSLPLTPIWSPASGTARLQVQLPDGTLVTEFALDQNTDAIVYNFDVERPTVSELEEEGDCFGGLKIDDDFKWLYQLLAAPNDDWATWLGQQLLPAPFAICPGTPVALTAGSGAPSFSGPMFPTVSTCFGASWPL